LSLFTADFVWYLRNVLLASATGDLSKLEDFIDVSGDNLAQLSKDAKLVDTETLMRYIRVMSDLSNELKFATQKRVKLEVTLIKLCRPAMEQAEDIGELSGRVVQLENQLEQAIKALKETKDDLEKAKTSGGFAVGFGERQENSESNITAKEVKPVKRLTVEALPEDIKKIAASIDDIIASTDEYLMKDYLQKAVVTLADDGKSLEIIVSSKVAYDALSREEDRQKLMDLVAERTGLEVNIIITNASDGDDARNRFQDIRELVKIDIETDDKEEMI
jgi:DNA polymerase-3 subunit gamma/tau